MRDIILGLGLLLTGTSIGLANAGDSDLVNAMDGKYTFTKYLSPIVAGAVIDAEKSFTAIVVKENENDEAMTVNQVTYYEDVKELRVRTLADYVTCRVSSNYVSINKAAEELTCRGPSMTTSFADVILKAKYTGNNYEVSVVESGISDIPGDSGYFQTMYQTQGMHSNLRILQMPIDPIHPVVPGPIGIDQNRTCTQATVCLSLPNSDETIMVLQGRGPKAYRLQD